MLGQLLLAITVATGLAGTMERLDPAPTGKLTPGNGIQTSLSLKRWLKSDAAAAATSAPTLLLTEDFEAVDYGDEKWEQDINGRTGYIREGPRDVGSREGGSVDFGVSYCPDGSCYRSEYKRPTMQRSKDLRLGEMYWFGFTMMLPANDTYRDTSHPNIFHFQLHGGDNIGRPPVFGLSLHNATHPLHWRIYSVGDDRPSSAAPNRPKWSQEFDIGAVKFGEWEDFVVRIKFETTPVGSLVVWRNGNLVVNKSSIATAYNDHHPPYIKLGSYVNKPFKAKSGVHTSWWGARYWQLKVGRADSSYTDVNTAHKTKHTSKDFALERQSTLYTRQLTGDDRGVAGLPPSPRPAEAFSAPQPPYPPLDPPFEATWDLARSTIIHTGNSSGFTDGVSAAKYGIISFDWGNNKQTWCKHNCANTFNEASMVEQAKQVKAANKQTKVYVYRAANVAQPWQESQRKIMYDAAYAGFFLRCSDGQVWFRGDSVKKGSCGGVNLTSSGRMCDYEGAHTMIWNLSNLSASNYFIDEVCMGPLGTGNVHVDGLYIDDAGPGTHIHPQNEYIDVLRTPTLGMNLSDAEVAQIASGTYHTLMRLRQRLQQKGKAVWLHGTDFGNPFHDAAYTNCTGDAGLCGWWLFPTAGDDCSDFYRSRCGQLEHFPLSFKMDRFKRHGGWTTVTNLTFDQSWNLTIATMLLLRGPQAYLVPSAWQSTDTKTPLLWSTSLDLHVGKPLESCKETSPNVFERRWSGGFARVDCNRNPQNIVNTVLAFRRKDSIKSDDDICTLAVG